MNFQMRDKITLTIQPYGKRVIISKDVNILEGIRQAGIVIRSVCGGVGECGKCKVIVKSGEIDFQYNSEEKLLSPDELSRNYVLACLTKCLSNCEIFIPPETRIEGQRIQIDVKLPSVNPDPVVKKMFIPYENLRIDLEEYLSRILNVKIKLPTYLHKKINMLKKLGYNNLTIVYRSDDLSIIDVEGGDTSKDMYGLAIDIGTTKIVVYLVNLLTGEILGSMSEYNSQIAYGEDVVSRISYALESMGGLSILQKAVIETINTLIDKLTSQAGVNINMLYDACVGGNTVMTYLFIGRDPSPLLETKIKVKLPKEEFNIDVKKLGLNINSNSKIYCLPSPGRFLGGDTIGDILVSGMHRSSEVSLLIDIGTNVEVVLGSKGWLLSTTAAAGPAFEGWGVRFGMRAIQGAIDSVTIDPASFKAKYRIIGDVKPKGICGSGLIDLLSEMFTKGIIDTLGKINRNLDTPLIREGVDGYEYIVVPREDSSLNTDIVITEKDIANLIDSKSAACAAISVLMKKMKLSVEDVHKVYICGAFGSYINPNSAMTIGLIPEFVNAEVIYIGNGSVGGAYLTLISKEYRDEAREISKLIAYYDLLKDADFMDEYLAGFVLPGKKELFPTLWEVSRKRKKS